MKTNLSKDTDKPVIPYDVYESNTEIVVLLPLWWVKKESLEINLKNYKLFIKWKRIKPIIEEEFIPLKEDCYRWDIEVYIDLPPQVYFEKIHSKLNLANILEIIIPKSNMPDKIPLEIEEEKKSKK